MITVLVADDSTVIRELLVHLLTSAGILVVGTAANGEEAVKLAVRLKPDVITMDIYMPVMNGIEATRKIMETAPAPIVIVSGAWNPKEVDTTFRALEAGALAVVQRPRPDEHPQGAAMAEELVRTVKLMSEVRVVRRWPREKMNCLAAGARSTFAAEPGQGRIEVVAIGASTGGPPVLQKILAAIPGDFPAPLLVVQHMSPGFLEAMLGWLGDQTALQLCIAGNGQLALPGHVYFAPYGRHMGIAANWRILLDEGPAEHGARPAVSYLFRSIDCAFGGKAAAILLTGMGRDGALEMRQLREKGALTIAQDQKSCAVYGMPAAAIELGGAVYQLAPEQIPPVLTTVMAKYDRRMKNGR